MTGRVGSALPCDCGHPQSEHTGPAGECDGDGYDDALNVGCPCDGYGITLDDGPELDADVCGCGCAFTVLCSCWRGEVPCDGGSGRVRQAKRARAVSP